MFLVSYFGYSFFYFNFFLIAPDDHHVSLGCSVPDRVFCVPVLNKQRLLRIDPFISSLFCSPAVTNKVHIWVCVHLDILILHNYS